MKIPTITACGKDLLDLTKTNKKILEEEYNNATPHEYIVTDEGVKTFLKCFKEDRHNDWDMYEIVQVPFEESFQQIERDNLLNM